MEKEVIEVSPRSDQESLIVVKENAAGSHPSYDGKRQPMQSFLPGAFPKEQEEPPARNDHEGCHWWPVLFFLFCFLPLLVALIMLMLFAVGITNSFFMIGGLTGSSFKSLNIPDTPGPNKLSDCKDNEIVINGFCFPPPCKYNEFYSLQSQNCEKCPNLPAFGKLVTSWKSDDANCDNLPNFVDVVNYGTAKIIDSVVDQNLQSSKVAVKKCINYWHNNCVKVLLSVGGPSGFDVKDPVKFAESSAKFVVDTGADGIDMDSRKTNGGGFAASETINAAKLLRASLPKSEDFYVSYAALANEADVDLCRGNSSRCFPDGIDKSLDWVNVQYYNINKDPIAAEAAYQDALKKHFPIFAQKMQTPLKVHLGTCVGSECALGPAPSDVVFVSWSGQGKIFYGGVMVTSAIADKTQDFKQINLANRILIRDKDYLKTKQQIQASS